MIQVMKANYLNLVFKLHDKNTSTQEPYATIGVEVLNIDVLKSSTVLFHTL